MNRPASISRLRSPAALLGAALAAACALAALPANWTAPAKSRALLALQPGQQAATVARQRVEGTWNWARARWQAADRLSAAEHELQRLRHENAALGAERDLLRAQLASVSESRDTESPLLRARAVSARVLGTQSRAYLARNHLIDAGTAKGIEPGDLVLDEPPMLDAGTDAGLKPGQLVVAGRRVLGKIAEAGRHTSTVRGITEPGYRDLVRIGGPDGPQGLLEGTGQPRARVRLVEVTAPVAVGAPVYSAAGEGILEVAPLCGRIAQLDRPKGATHWEISVEPAGPARRSQHLAVLQVEPNPERLAKQPTALR